MSTGTFENALVRLWLASGISQIGSAITWTGLPAYLAATRGELKLSASLFIASTAASLLTTLFASKLVDKGFSKPIAVSANIVCAVIVTILALFLNHISNVAYFAIALALSVTSSLGDFSVSAQYQSLAKCNNTEKALAKQGAIVSVAKIIGMGVGPVAFSVLGSSALILDAASFLAAGILIASASFLFTNIEAEPEKKQVQKLQLSQSLILWMSALGLGGLLSFPLVAASLQLLQQTTTHGPAATAAFWIVGSSSMTLSHLLSMKIKSARVSASQMNIFTTPIIIAGVSLIALNISLPLSLLGLAFVTGSFPAAGNLIRAEFLRRIEQSQLGRILGGEQIIRDSLALAALIVLTQTFISPQYMLAAFALVVVPLRAAIFGFLFAHSKQN